MVIGSVGSGVLVTAIGYYNHIILFEPALLTACTQFFQALGGSEPPCSSP